MRRGEIWVANLNPTRGREIGKVRPVVIMQADWLTELGADTIWMIPLTTQIRPALEPIRIRIRARDQLQHDCLTVTEKMRALDRDRVWQGPVDHANRRRNGGD